MDQIIRKGKGNERALVRCRMASMISMHPCGMLYTRVYSSVAVAAAMLPLLEECAITIHRSDETHDPIYLILYTTASKQHILQSELQVHLAQYTGSIQI